MNEYQLIITKSGKKFYTDSFRSRLLAEQMASKLAGTKVRFKGRKARVDDLEFLILEDAA